MGRALRNKQAAVFPPNQPTGHVKIGQCFARHAHGPGILHTAGLRQAHAQQGARQTDWILRQAYRSPQVHERLVQRPRLVILRQGCHQLLAQVPKARLSGRLAQRRVHIEDAAQHALQIAFEGRGALAVSQAQNGAGGVATDAGQAGQRGAARGKLPSMLRDDNLRSAVQVTCARIIAQTFPAF